MITFIILSTMLIDILVHGIADALNLKMLRNELPLAFKGLYGARRYRRSQEYLKVNTRFKWIVSFYGLIITLLFWFGHGFPILDNWVRSFELGPVLSGLIFMSVLLLAKTVLELPFDIYDTFVIETRFGFNKTTWKTYIADAVKGIGLALVIGGPLLAAVLAFFEYAGENAWFWCWLAVTVFSLIMQYVAPTWIMPIFNKFEPLEQGELKDAILSYAQSIDFSLENVFIMDGSKRSAKSNAFFTGFGKHKRIVLFDTLIKQHTVAELVAVLAHEMGHYKKKHIQMTLILGVLQTGIMFWLMAQFITFQELFDAFYMDKKSVYAGLIFFGMLYSALDFILGFFLQMLSRKNEFQADRFAAQTTGDADSLAEALKKLSVHNLSNLQPHPFYVSLNYSHPPVLERLKALNDQRVEVA
ncbi:M48 family metallopeptidase [Desulfococcaceae bacterium HSG9]|nr:M48 family metallopeptidase [Desulfococcaceae bacterium HSG9]